MLLSAWSSAVLKIRIKFCLLDFDVLVKTGCEAVTAITALMCSLTQL